MSLPQLKFVLICIAVVYFLMPLDLMPDAAGLLGRIDDIIVIGYLIRYYWRRKLAEQTANGNAQNKKADGETGAETSPTDPYAILGIQRGASPAEVTAAYKREAAKYHPDKVSHLGEELQKLAHERMLAISDAYERLRP